LNPLELGFYPAEVPMAEKNLGKGAAPVMRSPDTAGLRSRLMSVLSGMGLKDLYVEVVPHAAPGGGVQLDIQLVDDETSRVRDVLNA